MNELQKELNRIKNLKQNKHLDLSVLERIAQINLWKKQINIENRFSQKEDKELAEKYLENYLINYEIQDYNEVQNIADLVYEEILKHQVQKKIDEKVTDASNSFIPDKTIASLHDVEDRIWKLKEKAGITGSKETDDLTAHQKLKKQIALYIHFNRNQFTLFMPYDCRHCGKKDVQGILLNRRVDKFDCIKHPAFSGRFLFNIEVIDDVEAGKITKEMAARYLRTSPQYITWAIENRHKILEINGFTQEEINNEVHIRPHLGNPEDYNEK